MDILNSNNTPLRLEDQQSLIIYEYGNRNAIVHPISRNVITNDVFSAEERIRVIKKMLIQKNIRNIFFQFSLWYGLFIGTTASTYFTILPTNKSSSTDLFPFVIVASYYQVLYFFFGIYSYREKRFGVSSWFKTLGFCNIVGLWAVEFVMVINIAIKRDTSRAGMLHGIFNQLILPCLVGIPCHAILVGFITLHTIRQMSLLKERELLEVHLRRARNLNQNVQAT